MCISRDREVQYMVVEAKDTIPRVTHLTQFETVMDGLDEGLTFDELRVRLYQVAIDLARLNRGREPSGHPDFRMWSSTKDALEELMRIGWANKEPLPSTRHRVDAYRHKRFTLNDKGREWVRISGAGEARDALGQALIGQHIYFREYLLRLKKGSLLIPEFNETDIEPGSTPESLNYPAIVEKVVKRVRDSPAGDNYFGREITPDRIRKYVRRRFSKREPKSRKALLDAMQDAVAIEVLRSEGLRADPASFAIISSWSRELFITGTSRYVVESLGGWLHWIAADITNKTNSIKYTRRSVREFGDTVVGKLRSVSEELKTQGTEMIRVYPLRGTVAFRCGVANEVVDRVLTELVMKKRHSPYDVWVSAGALMDPPASEWPLSINGRRYHLVGFGNTYVEKEEE